MQSAWGVFRPSTNSLFIRENTGNFRAATKEQGGIQGQKRLLVCGFPTLIRVLASPKEQGIF
jgi:hypothetical protein